MRLEVTMQTVRVVCRHECPDIGEGATYQSTWLDVAAYQEAA
jgi:hypothetical protein